MLLLGIVSPHVEYVSRRKTELCFSLECPDNVVCVCIRPPYLEMQRKKIPPGKNWCCRVIFPSSKGYCCNLTPSKFDQYLVPFPPSHVLDHAPPFRNNKKRPFLSHMFECFFSFGCAGCQWRIVCNRSLQLEKGLVLWLLIPRNGGCSSKLSNSWRGFVLSSRRRSWLFCGCSWQLFWTLLLLCF